MKIIVSGAAGFIGSNLVAHLLQNTPYSVISLDDLSGTADLDNMQFALSHKNDRHKFHLFDVANTALLEKLISLESPSIYVDCTLAQKADIPGYAAKITNMQSAVAENHSNIKRFITLLPFTGCSYLGHKSYAINSRVIFGPRQSMSAIIPRMIKNVLNGQTALNIGLNEPLDVKTNILYIKDLVEAIVKCLDAHNLSRNIDISGICRTSLYDVGQYLNSIVWQTGKSLTQETVPYIEWKSQQSLPDWEPKKAIDQAIEHTLSWYAANKWALKE